ncbi:ECF RNA polymerase sigma factor SigK [mine drainage metagenome]|uniref:ECF RNA polymerase sigma factor SigK n=1 Tax=mine drainage metagenome TaxID=410659 RepID=A0A1J5S4R6_9ZZZZ
MYKAYYQFLFVYGFRISADKELTKDCVHESFLEIWNNRNSLPEVQHVGAYLKTIVRRKILKEIPKTVKQYAGDINDEKERTAESSYEDLLILIQSNQEMKLKVQKALLQLSPKQLEVIKMKFFEGKSYSEIAKKNASTARTVYNQIYEALKILRKHLCSF